MRIPPYQPTSTKGRFKGKSIPETMCCPINYGGHILLDVYGWLMDCIIHINTLHIHYITIGFSHQLCYMFQSHQSNESISMSCTRKKHLPTLKNVIVALPQVEFVLLVTKAGATWEEKIGASHVCMKNGLECAVWSEFWILMKMTSKFWSIIIHPYIFDGLDCYSGPKDPKTTGVAEVFVAETVPMLESPSLKVWPTFDSEATASRQETRALTFNLMTLGAACVTGSCRDCRDRLDAADSSLTGGGF